MSADRPAQSGATGRRGRNRLNRAPRLASGLKSLLVPAGPAERSIVFGPARGLRMRLDLQHDTQLSLGLYEHEIQRWLVELAAPARTLVDLGAARGRYTLYFLARTAAVRVVSVEPLAEVRRQLLRNLELNGLADETRLQVSPARVGAGEATGSTSLDSLLGEVPLPCLVKVDVEGDELAVLEGSSRLLESRDVSWVIEVHSAQLEEACARRLEGAGLTVRTVPNAWWRPVVPEMRPAAAVNHWLVACR